MFIGQALTNGTHTWIPIPKNASSSHRTLLTNNGWQKTQYGKIHTHQPAYIPIRHPLHRWYSGAHQHTKSNPTNLTIQQLHQQVLNGHNPTYDEHTLPQHQYILNTIHNPTLIKLENSQQWVQQNYGLTLPHLNKHTHPTNPHLEPIIKKWYAQDYELYNQAQ